MNAQIIDTTLREGEQTPGVNFSLEQKKYIIDGLAAIGINEIELGIASTLIDCPVSLLEYCRISHPQLVCSLWSRCNTNDIRHAATLAPDIISLSLPVSDILIREKLGKNREETVACFSRAISLAAELGLTVAVGLEDAFRAEPHFVQHIIGLAENHGAIRIRLADTVGTASPGEVTALIAAISSIRKKCAIAIHTHNDFGMATANAITALESGADCVDATLLGLGERCGCARLEEVAGYLHVKKKRAFNLLLLPQLCRYVAAATDRPIATNQPFTGRDIFTCETGLHLHALQKNPATYEPYPPETVGAVRRLLLSGKAGRKAIKSHIQSMGLELRHDLDDTTAKLIREILSANDLRHKVP
jgi:homocitrate synthase NifV